MVWESRDPLSNNPTKKSWVEFFLLTHLVLHMLIFGTVCRAFSGSLQGLGLQIHYPPEVWQRVYPWKGYQNPKGSGGSSDPSNYHFLGVFAVKLLGSNGPRFWTYILGYRIFPSSGDDPIIQSCVLEPWCSSCRGWGVLFFHAYWCCDVEIQGC